MVKQFDFCELDIAGVFLISPFLAEDSRGSTLKDYSLELFSENGISFKPVETLFITSKKNVLRGLHFQRVKPQAKLLRCICGSVQATVADLRKSSPQFGHYVSVELSGDNMKTLFIPEGCALGTLAFEDSLLECQCGEKFYAEYSGGIRWDDPAIGVKWQLDRLQGDPILSEKDAQLESLKDNLIV